MLIDEHTSITVYMDRGDCFRSHCLRAILSRKQIEYNHVLLDSPKELPPEIHELKGDAQFPVLNDRHLCLDNLLVTAEYLDERFPYPPMMPLDPVTRARMRLSLIYVYERWGGLLDEIKVAKTKTVAKKPRRLLEQDLANNVGMFGGRRYLGGVDFGLLDGLVASIFWRLPGLGVKLEGKQTEPLRSYQKRVFDLPEFRGCMIESDDELHSVG